MGGCDFSTRPYSYDDTPGDSELLDFALTEDDLIYKVRIYNNHSCKPFTYALHSKYEVYFRSL